MESLQNLKDIEGLHSISIWPLAPGWYVAIAIAITTGLFLIKYYRHKKSWQYRLLQEISILQQQSNQIDGKDIAQQLSLILRSLSINISQREKSAGLAGNRWLTWLEENDPNGFAWSKKGEILTEWPYRPKIEKNDLISLKELINSSKIWLKSIC